MLLQMKIIKRKAFTLSEILITLTIIGIVSAITVPVIYANYQKEALKAAFTKTYSDLNNVARKFYSDNGISFSEYAASHTIAASHKQLMSYFNLTGTATSKVWNTDSSDYNEVDNTYHLKLLSGKVVNYNICDVTSTISDLSGRLFTLNDAPSSEENGPVVCVDINGLRNPNKYGADFFLFIFTLDNTVIPMGMEHKNNTSKTAYEHNFFLAGEEYCKKNSSSYTHNFTCAYYALADKSPLNSNKSYWKDFL